MHGGAISGHGKVEAGGTGAGRNGLCAVDPLRRGESRELHQTAGQAVGPWGYDSPGPAQDEELCGAAKVSNGNTGWSDWDSPAPGQARPRWEGAGTQRRDPQEDCQGCSWELPSLQGSS